ncbi:M14 family metallopeptidase [Gracilimonas mengyeensis]|uniref:Zinc carboxypeptidase n=1 Tax=Gracilimonas mengyeensis TaxID=1302730 RepID=A0A521BWJ8_9BACT|nr:M14 family metallopeptidase [Gracilimonas mengyeensis]SMO51563.1 Zinc carboxypeptidase [Gracilimonas mengyeensis]
MRYPLFIMFNKYSCILLISFLMISCSGSKEFSGFSYDPPDVTNTTDKEIEKQPARVIGSGEPRIWASNDFAGARLNDFYMRPDSVFQLIIEPENAPINNSPWFAFKLWSDSARTANIELKYNEGRHRYIPKVFSRIDGQWELTDRLRVHYDSTDGSALMKVHLTTEPKLIAAQPLYTFQNLEQTLQERGILGKSFTHKNTAGMSKEGRPILQLDITEVPESQTAPVLAIVGRQHPPEVTGYLASLIFLEELTSDSELAQRFRQTFVIKAFPMLNPDGADMGHWRHNAGGVDLNRDWQNFNQPETQAVRDALTPLKEDPKRQMFYAIDFHSTNENIFYPINEEVETSPDNITQKWIDLIVEENEDFVLTVEPFDTSSPIAKNWFYHTFGIDALTYEVNDRIPDEKLGEVSRSAARQLMQLLLEEWEQMPVDN